MAVPYANVGDKRQTDFGDKKMSLILDILKHLWPVKGHIPEGGLGHGGRSIQEIDLGFSGIKLAVKAVGMNEVAGGYLGNLGLQTSFVASYLR